MIWRTDTIEFHYPTPDTKRERNTNNLDDINKSKTAQTERSQENSSFQQACLRRGIFDECQNKSKLQNCSMFPPAFVAGWLQGHRWGFISRNYVEWPIFFLMNVFIALKGSHFWFLFDFTAAGVVPCGGRKTSPRTSTIVQFIFYFGSLRSAIIFWEIRNKWLV